MKPFFRQFPRKGLICAHRGARSIAPENSRLALEQARACGADLWETDVQLTADGELVLFHDETLERTTDVTCRKKFNTRKGYRVRDFTASEISELDAGSWFVATDPYGTIRSGDVGPEAVEKIKGQRVLRCREALEYCRDHHFPANLEIKDQGDSALGEAIVDTLLTLIDQTATADLVLVSSFNHAYLHRIRQYSSSLATAALVEDVHPKKLVEYLKNLGCDAYHPHWALVDKRLIAELNRSGIEVSVWTVNDLAEAERLRRAGAFFICSDWPQCLL